MIHERSGIGFPPLTPAIKQLLLINFAVFVVNAVLAGRLSERGGWFAMSWDGLWDGFGLGLLRLLSYQFTHSFTDPLHLLWNMLMLYFFGTMAEGALGQRGTWRLYLVGGLVAALVHLAVAVPQGHGDVPLVGASGACFALLVYAACMAPRSLVIVLFLPVQLGILAAAMVFLGAYATYVELVTGYAGGVAHSAHLGGAALGFLAHRRGWFRDYRPVAWPSGWWSSLRQGWSRRRAARQQAQRAQEQLQLDDILAKVKAEGLGALTKAERRVLERASERARRR